MGYHKDRRALPLELDEQRFALPPGLAGSSELQRSPDLEGPASGIGPSD